MKCSRPKCLNAAWAKQGLCHKHYQVANRGYRPAEPVRQRIQLLMAMGWGCRELSDETGICVADLLSNRHHQVRVNTWDVVMAIPVPHRVVAKGGVVDATGTRRRIQALAAIGWTQHQIAAEAGVHRGILSNIPKQRLVLARVAVAIADAFERMSATPGPNEKVRERAVRARWAPPLAWDDIDDPDEKPDTGKRVTVTAIERVTELHNLGITDANEIAGRLGIQPDSVKRTLLRTAS